MYGNVLHDAGSQGYKKSLKKLRLIHYNILWERVKRKIPFFNSFL